MAAAPRLEHPLRAYRAFREAGGDLYSLTSGTYAIERWPVTGIVDAVCNQTVAGQVPHLAPVLECECGVHAVDSLATLEEAVRVARRGWGVKGDIVLAAVLLWSVPGRNVIVKELTKGGYEFRAPRMQIVALADSPAARRVAGRHPNVWVMPPGGLESYAREHGTQRIMAPAGASRPSAVVAPRVTPTTSEPQGPSLVERLVRRACARRPWVGTVILAVLRGLWATLRLVATALWKVMRAVGVGLAWFLPRAGRSLVWAAMNPASAVCLGVTVLACAAALLVWAGDVVRGVVHL